MSHLRSALREYFYSDTNELSANEEQLCHFHDREDCRCLSNQPRSLLYFSFLLRQSHGQVGLLASLLNHLLICPSLEQNIGLIAANVLTLGPLFSASARHMLTSGSSRSGKGPSRAGSTRPITRASSRASARSSNPDTEGDIDLDRKQGGRRTSLIIEGPRRDSFDGQRSRSQNSMRSRNNFIDDGDDDDYDLGSRSYRHHHRRGESVDEVDLEAWPRGIIKTVSVEVVEEVNEDYHHAQHGNHQRQGSRGGIGGMDSNTNGSRLVPMVRAASRAGDNSNRVSGASGLEQDWETMLRNGPPGK
jgi:hypothetical protein